MFDGGPDQAHEPSSAAADWGFPGRPTAPAGPVEPDPVMVALSEAVEDLLSQDPSQLAGAVALDRCRTVLAQTERLGAVAATALADVQDRELWAADGAGSLASWLRQQPCGDGGRSTRSRRLAQHEKLRAAIVDGALGLSTADLLGRALAELPKTTEPGQVEGVLTGAVPELLSRWSARNALDPAGDPVAEQRAAQVQAAIDAGLANPTATPAQRLEAAYVLIGQAVSPAALASQLQLIADALQPEQLAAEEAETYDGRSLILRKKKLEPGYRLRAELTDEVGARLQAELDARAAARKLAEAALRKAAGGDGAGDGDGDGEDLSAFGTVGPGTPVEQPAAFGFRSSDDDVLDGPPLLTDDQLAHDLFGELLEDLTGVREPGAPQPATITITAGLDTLEGRFGALPGTMLLPDGPFPLSLDALRRMGCDSRLNAVLLDAARSPIGASGTHRHATDKERRALRAKWGDYCAGNGCGSTDTVPHHVPPWWKTGRTKLEDLVPLCKSDHHDVHDGHRTIRLRDGRLIDENGWVDEPDPPQQE
jgi:hypothetical protein